MYKKTALWRRNRQIYRAFFYPFDGGRLCVYAEGVRRKEAQMEKGETLEGIVQPLLRWYDSNARELPWRENKEPYRVWVSEIMLQQTRVEAVKPYFERFLRELPTVAELAQAEEDVLLKLWEGLGYYSRVRNMKKAAQILMEQYGGQFPEEAEELKKLPGIGDYTAGAISSISFGRPAPAVDGNVLRVVSRLAEDPRDMGQPGLKREVAQGLRQVYPEGRAGDFTQSLMELGAIVCLPNGAPLCQECPLREQCGAFLHGTQGDFPKKAEKKARKVQEKTVFLILRQGRLAVKKRDAEGLLAGLWELPNGEGRLTAEEARAWLEGLGLQVGRLERIKKRKHVFTHVEWRMTAYRAQCSGEGKGLVWATAEDLASRIPLPTAFKQFLEDWSEEQEK